MDKEAFLLLAEARVLLMPFVIQRFELLFDLLRKTVRGRARQRRARSLKADVADHKVLAAVDFHRQRLCKADTVEFTADLAALIQPLNQRNAFDRHVHHLHIMKLQRLLKKKCERGVSQLGWQFIVRFTGKHPAKTVHLQRGFVTLLLLKLKTTLGNRPS